MAGLAKSLVACFAGDGQAAESWRWWSWWQPQVEVLGGLVVADGDAGQCSRRVAEGLGEGGGVGQVGGVDLETASGASWMRWSRARDAAHRDEAADRRRCRGQRARSVRRKPMDRVRPLPCRRTGATMRPSGVSWSRQAWHEVPCLAVTMIRSYGAWLGSPRARRCRPRARPGSPRG